MTHRSGRLRVVVATPLAEQHCELTSHAVGTAEHAATHLPSKQLLLQQALLVVQRSPTLPLPEKPHKKIGNKILLGLHTPPVQMPLQQ